VARYVTYDRAQVERDTGVSADRLVVLVAAGDELSPDVRAGEKVLAAKHDGPIRSGLVYLWQNKRGGLLMKRARWDESGLYIDNEPRGKIALAEDDPAWSPILSVIRVEKAL
jgi:hypothetical protein